MDTKISCMWLISIVKKPLLNGHRTELTVVVMDYISLKYMYVLKSVSVFAFTNKLKFVMKGNELELWVAFLTKCNFITVQSNR